MAYSSGIKTFEATGISVGTRAWLELHGVLGYYFTPCRLDTISTGSLIAVVEGSPLYDRIAKFRYVLFGGTGLVLAVGLFFASRSDDVWLKIAHGPAAALFYGGLIFLCIADPNSALPHAAGLAPFRFVGRLSYAMYVFHPFIFAWLDPWTNHTLAGLIVTFAAVVLAAFASWHLYEKRFLRLKRYFPYQRDVSLPGRAAPSPAP